MKIDTGLYPPEIVAKDILNSFSPKDVDEIIDTLQEGRKSMISDCKTQGVFSWGEAGEEWNQSGENQTKPYKINGIKN